MKTNVSISQLHKLSDSQLSFQPFFYYRTVLQDNNSFYRALGYLLSLSIQSYKSEITELDLNLNSFSLIDRKIGQTDFNKLRKTFLSLLEYNERQHFPLFQLKLIQLLRNRPYADILLILIVRNYLLSKFEQKHLSKEDIDALDDFYAEPTVRIIELSKKFFHFHIYKKGFNKKCEHQRCYFFYKSQIQFLILYQNSEFRQKQYYLQIKKTQYQQLRQFKFSKSILTNQPDQIKKVCVGCKKKIENRLACMNCIVQSVDIKQHLYLVTDRQSQTQRIKLRNIKLLASVADKQPIKVKGKRMTYGIISESVQPKINQITASKRIEAHLQIQYNKQINSKETQIQFTDSDILLQSKQNKQSGEIKQVKYQIEKYQAEQVQFLCQQQSKQIQMADKSKLKEPQTLMKKNLINISLSQPSLHSRYPQQLSPLKLKKSVKNILPSIRYTNIRLAKLNTNQYDRLKLIRKRVEKKAQTERYQSLSVRRLCQQCEENISGPYRYCSKYCQKQRLRKICREVDSSRGSAEQYMLSELQDHMHKRLWRY